MSKQYKIHKKASETTKFDEQNQEGRIKQKHVFL